jgi:hypothetical protein
MVLEVMFTVYVSMMFSYLIYMNDLEVKGKVVPVHTMKTYRVSRGMAPLILNLYR